MTESSTRPESDRPHYDVHPGNSPYCLFVHGYLSSRAQWIPNLTALSKVVRPVVLELLGHGRSPSPEDPRDYSPAAYIEHFERIRTELGVEKWLICGHSLGAALTLRYALDRPDRVVAQVFTNSMSALAPDEWSARVRPAMQAQARMFEERGRSAIEEHPLNPLRSRRLANDVRRAFEADLLLADPLGLARTGLYTVPDSPVRSRIAGNTVPSLLIAGDREARFAESREFAERNMPHLQVVRLDGGHAINLDAPEAFNSAIVTFFAEHARVGTAP